MTYDANGDLSGDGRHTYGWDSRGRLVSLMGAATASFTYDATGRQSGKTINGTTTNFLYDGANAVQELTGGTPTANLLTGLGIDEVFSRTDGLGTRSLVTDALGSTVALTDGSGAVKTSYAYEPYGNTTASGEVNASAGQYTGRENDGTGLYYYRARYYHPGFSRFVAEDPIGFAGGTNLYAYVGGNPLGFVDSFGLHWQYSQSTGNWSYIDNQTGAVTPEGQGYSGTGDGRNNPAMQDVPNTGPIPEGSYEIGSGHYSRSTGPNTMNLTPLPGTNTLGRDLFRIHGDNAENDASEGCPIAPPGLRNRINNSSDRILQVVP